MLIFISDNLNAQVSDENEWTEIIYSDRKKIPEEIFKNISDKIMAFKLLFIVKDKEPIVDIVKYDMFKNTWNLDKLFNRIFEKYDI